ncbi:MAG TPA: alpha/beta hydrolase [Yinghuangia sp.]|uniref:alpha/beta hydrolase n=1 Tax=Yinghuangia sp. YIM S10712 TaxID=3436930 RepID=UPI002CF4D95F|nr:alpha/beta hydrolase [Yinghuangia sp.]
MAADELHPSLRVPAREVPVPATVSAEAQAFLAAGVVHPFAQWPAPDDHDAWASLVAEQEKMTATAEARDYLGALMAGGTDPSVRVDTETVDMDGVRVFVATPEGTAPDDRRVYLAIHGGNFTMGGGDICRANAAATAASLRTRVWGIDYRMPPRHPHPAPLDDCVTVYRSALRDRAPQEIAIGGTSAGGNLTATSILRARDEGLPLPAAAVLCTPATDLTAASDTLRTNSGVDTTLTGDLLPLYRFYAGSHDPRDPYLSPVYGDFTRGFPPTALFSGTRDVLLSDTVRLHRALRGAGVTAELHVFEAAPHAMFFGTAPEDRERSREIRHFLDRHRTGPRPDPRG